MYAPAQTSAVKDKVALSGARAIVVKGMYAFVAGAGLDPSASEKGVANNKIHILMRFPANGSLVARGPSKLSLRPGVVRCCKCKYCFLDLLECR